MKSCLIHGKVPWSTRFGCCLHCLAAAPIPDPPCLPPTEQQGGWERFQLGTALTVWTTVLALVAGIGLLVALVVFLLFRLFDWAVLSGIDWLRPFDTSGWVTDAMWWGYVLIFIVAVWAVPILWLAWMYFWRDPEVFTSVRRVIGFAK